MAEPEVVVTDQNLYLAFQAMKKQDFDVAKKLIDEGVAHSKSQKNSELEGLYLSAMGLLFKLKKEYKKSYKSYQQAERLLKDDHSIKIISAVLLIEQFKQYETAIRKLKKIIGESEDPAIIHHAQSLLAMSYFLMKKNDLAKEEFEKVLAADFKSLRYPANIEFKAVELFVNKKFNLNLCEQFLKKSLELAKQVRDQTYTAVIEALIQLIKA